MKTKLFVLLMLTAFSLNAQEMFYYYHGKKIDLTGKTGAFMLE